jgi:hypothetical protein
MVDIRRQDVKVKKDRREYPRLEFHCRVSIRGIDQVLTVTDISMGGFFFELVTKKKLKLGSIVDVSMRLPTEINALRFKAKLVNQNERGVGCKYISLTPDVEEAIRNCFETFKDTIPLA